MAIQEVKRHRIISTLVTMVFTHAEMMMRNGATAFIRINEEANILEAASGDPAVIAEKRDEAKLHLRHATEAPARTKNRIQALIANLTTKLGNVSAARQFIDDGIAAYLPDTNRTELVGHLDSLITIVQTAIDGKISSGWTLLQMAEHLRDNSEDDNILYAIQIDNFTPVDYPD